MITLKSDNKYLEHAFDWAVKKTAQFVVTGTKQGPVNKGEGNKWYGPNRVVLDAPDAEWAAPKDYQPAFWAGYFDRTAYYIRDFVHQAAGAHLVGLDREIFSMFYTFVSNAGEKTGWYAPWAFNFDNSIYYMDTPDYNCFVREMTAQFELVETAYSLYLRTGDRRYIEDPDIFLFVEKIMGEFIDCQDGVIFKEKNGIPEGRGDIWQGSATYNERGFHAAEAGDCIAAMYQAMLAYSGILAERGEPVRAAQQKRRAEKLKQYFNEDWSAAEGSGGYCYAIDNYGIKHTEWEKNGSVIHGSATCFFMPMKELTERGERNDRLLTYIQERELDDATRDDNIESLTYLPEVFFPYHQNERAWYWMKYIIDRKDLPHEHQSQGTNGDYPEISFTFISQTAEGLMGIRPQAESGCITTCPHLPKEIGIIELEGVVFGTDAVDIALTPDQARLSNRSERPLVWQCGFAGRPGKFLVNGCVREPDGWEEEDPLVSFVRVQVQPQETAEVQVMVSD